jgi:hypothetical protein
VSSDTTTWPDLAEGLYERLTGRGTAIAYTFEDMLVEVPRDTTPDAPRATWRLHGTVRITTAEPPQR